MLVEPSEASAVATRPRGSARDGRRPPPAERLPWLGLRLGMDLVPSGFGTGRAKGLGLGLGRTQTSLPSEQGQKRPYKSIRIRWNLSNSRTSSRCGSEEVGTGKRSEAMANGGDGDVPENANERKANHSLARVYPVRAFYDSFSDGFLCFAAADCPGTQSEAAGKAESCAGCPNQQICATAPKGPDPGNTTLPLCTLLFPCFPSLIFVRLATRCQCGLLASMLRRCLLLARIFLLL